MLFLWQDTGFKESVLANTSLGLSVYFDHNINNDFDLR